MAVNWSDIAAAVGKAAPLVGTLLAGPAGAAVGGLVASALGSEPTPAAVAAAVADPALALKLAQYESDNAVKLQAMVYAHAEKVIEANVALAATDANDRDSARKNNVAGGTARGVFELSITLLALCLGSEVWVLFNGLPDHLPPLIVGRVLGLLDSVCLMVLAYHYGSSSGSAQKTELLSQAPAIK
jgi:hypothetical protein